MINANQTEQLAYYCHNALTGFNPDTLRGVMGIINVLELWRDNKSNYPLIQLPKDAARLNDFIRQLRMPVGDCPSCPMTRPMKLALAKEGLGLVRIILQNCEGFKEKTKPSNVRDLMVVKIRK